MSIELWHRVAERLAEHGYMTGVERTVERVRSTGEVFTPSALVIEMLSYLDLELFAPGKSVLDPACGDGQFLVAAKWLKVYHHGMSAEEALGDIYGVDVMRDNVDLCRRRLGGGTVIMGDSLRPTRRLEGQTQEEWEQMVALFHEASTSTYKKARTRKPKSRQVHVADGSTNGGLNDKKPVVEIDLTAHEELAPTLF